ncbi:hypothetical protein [Yinghuangia seranimata]|uniref:hypothetical protein n=1 Tax=Yinghuangia seranimata TaxID=408067 RepID=UPI00248B7C3F|nr:hypothetical protein [Yinghuangia seranimata]MDI2129353.1 hypothetical protein [Yinghuangia seranimata]
MVQYELFQIRQQEMHRAAAHERLVARALRARREARRQERAAAEASSRICAGVAGSVRPAV